MRATKAAKYRREVVKVNTGMNRKLAKISSIQDDLNKCKNALKAISRWAFSASVVPSACSDLISWHITIYKKADKTLKELSRPSSKS